MTEDPPWALTAGSLRLRFEVVEGLWQHRLELRDPNRLWRTAVRFVPEALPEADARSPGPGRGGVPPQFQEAQFQTAGVRPQALMVGRSGRHHDSGVFRLERGGPGIVRCVIDLARRCSGPIADLSCLYELDPETCAPRSGDDRRHDCRISWAPTARLRLEVSEPSRLGLVTTSDHRPRFRIGLAVPPNQPTLRLVYQWSWLEPGPSARPAARRVGEHLADDSSAGASGWESFTPPTPNSSRRSSPRSIGSSTSSS